MNTSTIMTSRFRERLWVRRGKIVSASFDRFCLAAGIETLGAMMEADAEVACGPRHSRSEYRRGHRWGTHAGKIGFHGGKVASSGLGCAASTGKSCRCPSWEQALDEDWLGQWAMNLMLINVSTRKFGVRSGCPRATFRRRREAAYRNRRPRATSSRSSAARMKEWMAADLSSSTCWWCRSTAST